MEILGVSHESWFPVFTLLLGAVGKGIGDALGDKRLTRRESRARIESRADAVRARHVESQRETLLGMHQAMWDLAGCAGSIHVADAVASRETGEWGKKLLGEDLNEKFSTAHRLIQRLRVRVASAQIRDLALEFADACANVSNAKSLEDSTVALHAVLTTSSALNDQIGDALRALDHSEI